ncbi:MAG: hypothetical protein RL189_3070 [Pseudomonadota bacterium]
MSIRVRPSHVAVLVPSVRKAGEFLQQFGFQIGQEEVWDSEGTKEIYVERDKANSILLMEPIKPGAYQRAIEKRGPGLHHLAIDVENLEDYIESLAASGWLLHPISIKTMKQSRTAYLARPGFPGLIEVQERKECVERPIFVDRIEIPLDSQFQRLIDPIGLSGILMPSKELIFSLEGRPIKMEDLL